jgi:hypothetical protein
MLLPMRKPTPERARGMIDWQPIETAPLDGTWILAINNRGNCAVIIWAKQAVDRFGGLSDGWIHPFTTGELSSFWNGACGSVPVAWAKLPHGEEAGAVVDRFERKLKRA